MDEIPCLKEYCKRRLLVPSEVKEFLASPVVPLLFGKKVDIYRSTGNPQSIAALILKYDIENNVVSTGCGCCETVRYMFPIDGVQRTTCGCYIVNNIAYHVRLGLVRGVDMLMKSLMETKAPKILLDIVEELEDLMTLGVFVKGDILSEKVIEEAFKMEILEGPFEISKNIWPIIEPVAVKCCNAQ